MLKEIGEEEDPEKELEKMLKEIDEKVGLK